MRRKSFRENFQLALICAALAAAIATSVSCTKKVDDKDTTIHVALKANVKGLDPISTNDQYASMVVMQVYEGLLQYNYLKRPYTLEPLLADGMPTVSADGLTHTFKIKKGIRFQDNAAFPDGKGREVTAEDFIYSFRRLADPRNTSDGFWIFDGKVKGLNSWAEAVKAGKADYSTPIEGFQAPDKQTLIIKLTQPYYQLHYVLAMPFASVVPREAVEKYGQEFLNNPVGTGAFYLAKQSDWIRNSTMTLKRNPNFHSEVYPSEGEGSDKANGLLADAGQTLPFAEKLIFTELPEDQPRWQNFSKGNFEFAEIPNDNFDSAMKDGKVAPALAQNSIRLDTSPNLDTTYIGVNQKDPVLGKSKFLRQAMSMASDNATLVQRFYNGRAIIAESPVPPGVDGYDASYKNPYDFNVEKAKQLLVKAGYPEGKGLPEFTLDNPASAKNRQISEFFAQNMAAIGIKIRIASSTWPQFQDKIKKGESQLFGIAWGADYPDAQNYYQLFYSKNFSLGPNDTWYSNPAFDKLYEDSLKLPQGPARLKIYNQLRDIVVEDSPWILNTQRVGVYLYHGWLNNFKHTDMAVPFAKYLRVDPKKRAELKPKL